MNVFSRPIEIITIVLLFVSLCACGGGGGGSPTPAPAGSLQFSTASYDGSEETTGRLVTVTVSRTGGSQGTVSVDYATAGDTATAGDDFTAIAATTLNWSDGDADNKTFQIQLTDDAEPELTEQLTVKLSNITGGALLGTIDTTRITIIDNDSVTITGTVAAPNGSLAFNGPTMMQHMLAGLFGKTVVAGIEDLTVPVANATVEVLQVDADGNVVGNAITTNTTDSAGHYILAAPMDAPASHYIVRASGLTGSLDSRISDTTVAVNPVTDATSGLIASVTTNLADISTEEILQIQNEVENLLPDVLITGKASAISANLFVEAQSNGEVSNIIISAVASGTICGTVTKGSGITPLENIRIVVRNYSSWVAHAKTRTAADGSYCVNVPFDDYIVGALNNTGDNLDSDLSASEWWTATGGTTSQFGAEQVSVPDATPVSLNFDLTPGARMQGTVTTFNGGSAEGARVLIRDYESFVPVASARVKPDGTYRVNVPAGDYLLEARNQTLSPYASQIFDAPTANNNLRNAGARQTVIAGETLTADFALTQGRRISGQVLDAPGGNIVPGMRVRFDLGNSNANYGGPAARVRTNTQGQYRMWLKPDVYNVQTRGQSSLVDITSVNAANTDFDTEVGTVTAIVEDANTNRTSQAKAFLYSVNTSNASNFVYNRINQEVTNSNGSVTLYAPAGSYKLLIRIDSEELYASTVYNNGGNVTAINTGTDITVTNGNNTNVGTITLPTQGAGTGAGVLRGTAPLNGTTGLRGGQLLEVRNTTTNNTTRFFVYRTLGDGTYVIPMPTGNYTRLRIGGVDVNTSGDVVITDGDTTDGQN